MGIGFELRKHDLRGLPDSQEQLSSLVDEEARASFDLERGPLARGRLIQMSADDHVLLITMHHIISDGWSLGILERELSVLYSALIRAEPDPLEALAVQYADYAAWQRRCLSGQMLAEQSSYWRGTLSGSATLLELPVD